MDLEAWQERRHIEAKLARANLHRWKMGRQFLGFLIFLGFNALLVVGMVATAQLGFFSENNAWWITVLVCVLDFGCMFVIMAPYTTKLQRLEQAWFSAYATEVIATITGQREVPSSSGEGTSRQLQLTWSPPTGGKTLSFWEPVAPVHTRRYPLGTRVWLHYDPADLSFHRIRWHPPVP
jgi:hypothetical protein